MELRGGHFRGSHGAGLEGLIGAQHGRTASFQRGRRGLLIVLFRCSGPAAPESTNSAIASSLPTAGLALPTLVSLFLQLGPERDGLDVLGHEAAIRAESWTQTCCTVKPWNKSCRLNLNKGLQGNILVFKICKLFSAMVPFLTPPLSKKEGRE